MNIDDRHTLTKPWNRTVQSSKDHNSCWDCEFIRVAGQCYRICAIFKKNFIWAGDAENEFFELGKTVADECPAFTEDNRTGFLTDEDIKREKEFLYKFIGS